MQKITSIIATLLTVSVLASCQQQAPSSVTIGIILPIEHAAMQEIVAGYSDTLKAIYNKPVIIKVENAQGDANLERAIIQKMRNAHYKIIVPIGTDATQMSLAIVKSQPIVSIASDFTDHERKKLLNCNIAVVHDEISSNDILTFIHAVYPHIKQLTLIHSTANKVFPQVADTIAAGKRLGITIHPLMISTLPDLYQTANAIPSTSQGIFILKDNLIVSGIATLVNVASKKQLPLITSDQGSVEQGASFALGVPERDIGLEGAKLTAAILEGKSACELPIANMKKLVVFFNKNALEKTHQGMQAINAAAQQFAYQPQDVLAEKRG